MKRFLLALILSQLPFGGTPAPTPTVMPHNPMVVPFGGNSSSGNANQDQWIIGIADLQVWVTGDVYQTKLDDLTTHSNNPLGTLIENTGTALAFRRADAESRISTFIHDLCSHDFQYCNVSMAINRVRFTPIPNPFVH